MLTDNPNDPRIKRGGPDKGPVPQNEVYLVLSDEERKKGFVRPYRESYIHVGTRPQHELRDLTYEEKVRYADRGYAKFEVYPSERHPVTGRFWTQADLDARQCGGVTTMTRAISETYARDPKFYGSTYCVKCSMHKPVGEFRWTADGQVVGS